MKYFIIISIILVFISCSSDPKTDSELLEKDRTELAEHLQSFKVTTYKFGKIVIRSSAEKDTLSPEFMKFKSDFDRIHKLMNSIGQEGEELSVLDYISVYRDYKKMEDYIAETDEDIFPTVLEAFGMVYRDSIQNDQPLSKSTQKEYSQNIEHTLFSAFAIVTRGLGKEVSLYECSKIKPGLFPDIELKTMSQFYSGFLYFEKGFYYLSEDEFTRNIAWLSAHPEVALPHVKSLFEMAALTDEQTHIAFRAMNYLFRGFDRLIMERDIDKKRALEDFEAFLKDSKEVGIDNEMTWSVETYMYLHNNQKENAIASLSKLKASDLLSTNEKERIEESIRYLKTREEGAMLNGVYDKFFLGKIASKYVLSVLAKVDWKKVLKENEVPHTDEMFESLENFQEFLKNLETYSSEEKLKEIGSEVGDELKDQGKNLWNKATELLEDTDENQ